jgi:hypothetical protein
MASPQTSPVWLNELDDFPAAPPARNAFLIAVETTRGLWIGGLFDDYCAPEHVKSIFQSNSWLLKAFAQVIGELAGSKAVFIT